MFAPSPSGFCPSQRPGSEGRDPSWVAGIPRHRLGLKSWSGSIRRGLASGESGIASDRGAGCPSRFTARISRSSLNFKTPALGAGRFGGKVTGNSRLLQLEDVLGLP